MYFTHSHRLSLCSHSFHLFWNSVKYQWSRALVQIVENYWEGRSTSSLENTEFPRSNLNTSYLNNLNVSKCSFCFEEKMSFFITH